MDDDKGFYQVNKEKGSFITWAEFARPHINVYIGALPGRGTKKPSLFFNGSIAVMDIYSFPFPPESVFPVEMRNVIMADHRHRVDKFYPKTGYESR